MKITTFFAGELYINERTKDVARIKECINMKYKIPVKNMFIHISGHMCYLSLVPFSDLELEDERLTEMGCPKEIQAFYLDKYGNKAIQEIFPLMYENKKIYASNEFIYAKRVINLEDENILDISSMSDEEKRYAYKSIDSIVNIFFNEIN